jgi:hypothetical protein
MMRRCECLCGKGKNVFNRLGTLWAGRLWAASLQSATAAAGLQVGNIRCSSAYLVLGLSGRVAPQESLFLAGHLL